MRRRWLVVVVGIPEALGYLSDSLFQEGLGPGGGGVCCRPLQLQPLPL